jgi:hypothetical protein
MDSKQVVCNVAPGLQGLLVPVGDLSSLEGNPRRGDVEAVARSYEMFGQRKPIIYQTRRKKKVVVAGNHQLKAALSLGWTHIAVVAADDLSKREATAYAIADNRVSDLGSYDNAALLDMLDGLDQQLLDAVSFDTDAMDALVGLLRPEPGAGGDDFVPAFKPDPVSRQGDVWLLGDHRLACGSATDSATVSAAMGGAAASAVWTDPPYGVSYVGKTADALTIANDNLGVLELRAFLLEAFAVALDVSENGASWWVTGPGGPLSEVFGSVLNELGVWRQQLIWVKHSMVMGRSDYHYKHEPIWCSAYWADGQEADDCVGV